MGGSSVGGGSFLDTVCCFGSEVDSVSIDLLGTELATGFTTGELCALPITFNSSPSSGKLHGDLHAGSLRVHHGREVA